MAKKKESTGNVRIKKEVIQEIKERVSVSRGTIGGYLESLYEEEKKKTTKK